MIKLKSLLFESGLDVEQYRSALSNYMDSQFPTEFDPKQQLLFGLTMDDLKKPIMDKVLNIKIQQEFGNDAPHGVYSGESDEIYIYFDPRKYDRSIKYAKYVDSVLFHELIHALNFYKKLWDKVSYDSLMMGHSYYGDPEEIRAYRAQIKNYLVNYLKMPRRSAELLMNKYSSDNSKYRLEWIPKYYDIS